MPVAHWSQCTGSAAPPGAYAEFLANVNSCSRSLYVVVHPSVVCLSSVTFVHPTQAIQIFGNISMPFGTLASRWHPGKILRRSSQGNTFVGGVKHKRGSRYSDFGPIERYISETVQYRSQVSINH